MPVARREVCKMFPALLDVMNDRERKKPRRRRDTSTRELLRGFVYALIFWVAYWGFWVLVGCL